jgi:hypothetical protein
MCEDPGVKAAARAIAENPGWSRKPKAWLKVALWAYRYSEVVPSRGDIAKALISDQHER